MAMSTDQGGGATRGAVRIIACPAVLGELEEGAADGLPCETLDVGLHRSPDKLREALRAAVAANDEPGVTIVLGYGMCSKGVFGLKTEHATLVVPRVDDCIALLLGSNEAFAEQARQERATYYLARGYIEACDTPFSEYERMAEKCGPERAERLSKMLLEHYTRLVLIDTGRYDLAPFREYAQRFADFYGLRLEEVPGTTRLVDMLVAGEWDDAFLVVPPGHEITLDDFHAAGGVKLCDKAAPARH
jgi:Protein of unknown function (DUF1638)